MPFFLLFLFLIYSGVCALIGYSFRSKKGGFWLHFLISFLLTPILGIIISAFTRKDQDKEAAKKLERLEKLYLKGILSDDIYTSKVEEVMRGLKA